jgi:tetratricopeptide (TPR) repeat protein
MDRLLMRKLNIKLFVILAVSAVLLGGAVYLVHYLQSGRIARALLWQARRAESQGRLDQTARYLARYLEFNPEDIEERANLGRTLASDKVAPTPRGRQRALFVLEQVLSRDPARHDLRRLLVPVAMELRRYDLVGEHLAKLREAAPNDAEVEYLAGQWHEAQNEYTEAQTCYRRAIQRNPQGVDSYVRLAELLRRQPDPARQEENAREAERVLDELVAKNPQSYQAYLARWRHRKASGALGDPDHLAEAGRDVARAVVLAPQEADVLLVAAERARLAKDLKEARRLLEEGFKHHPHDVRFYQAQVVLELQAGRRLEAVACVRLGVKALTGTPQLDLLWTLGNLLIDSGEVAEAENVITQISKASNSPQSIDYLRARILLHQGQWSEAAKLLEQVRPQLVQSKAAGELTRQLDLYLGKCYEQLDEPGLRLAAFERVLSQDAQSPAARIGLAEAHLAMGRHDEALAHYRQLMMLPNAPPAGWLEIARLLLLRESQLDDAGRRELDTALRRAEEAQPNAPEVLLLRAEYLLARKQPEQAEQVLQQARDKEPKQVVLWTALATLAERQKDSTKAVQILDEAGQKVGDSVALRLAKARFWSNRKGAEATTALLKLREGADKYTAEDQSRLWRGLAEAHYRLGDRDAARRLWEELAQQPRHKNDLRLRLLLFNLAQQSGDEATLTRLLGEIRAIEGGQGKFWRFCEATRLLGEAAKGNRDVLEEARVHLDAVATRKPGWTVVLIAKARLEELRGNSEQAIANYRRAIDLGERSPRTVRQLVQLLYQRQRFDEADQEIRKLQKQSQQMSAELQRLAADVSLRNQDPIRAVEMALQAVSADSTDYRDHIWLGQVLAAGGEPRAREAEEHFRRAVELDGKAPEGWIALVRFLVGRNQTAEAEAVVARARAKLPADKAPLTLAQCCDAVGKSDAAREQYEKALAARPDDLTVLRGVAAFYLRAGRAADSERCLRQVLERKGTTPDRELTWARHAMALLLAGNGSDFGRTQEALKLVGLRLDRDRLVEIKKPAPEELVEELRTRARVLAAHRNKALRNRAITLLEDVDKRGGLAADDTFLLAQLYESEGVWPKAREQYRNLVTSYKDQPTYLIFYARGLLAQREFGEAQRCVERLEQLEKSRRLDPGSLGAVELKVRLLDGQGEMDKAIEALRAHAERKGAAPETALALAAYLARKGRAAEALDLCAKAWATCPAEVVASTSVAVLRAGQPTPDQCRRVGDWLTAAIKKEPRSLELLLQLADLRDLEGRLPDSEALYRQVLDRQPKNVVALNNLAWLLAQKPERGSEALPLIDRAIETAGPAAELLDTRSTVYLALGRGDRAVADLEAATLDAPTATRYFHLARAHKLCNDSKAAARAFRQAKALKLRPEQLHPAERTMYQQLALELEER